METELLSYTVLACLIVSLCSLSSMLALWLSESVLNVLIPMLVALAAGVLLGDAFIHLIPDAIELEGSPEDICLIVLMGIGAFFLLEMLVRWHHEKTDKSLQPSTGIQPIARMNLISDGVHNFTDGILIAGSFLADPLLGVTTTLAIVAHEIPQELGDVGVLMCGGCTAKQAIVYNFLCSLTILPGALFTLFLHHIADNSLSVLLPIAAGGFIYIATAGLMPILQQQSNLNHQARYALFFALGIGCMQLMILLEHTLSHYQGA